MFRSSSSTSSCILGTVCIYVFDEGKVIPNWTQHPLMKYPLIPTENPTILFLHTLTHTHTRICRYTHTHTHTWFDYLFSRQLYHSFPIFLYSLNQLSLHTLATRTYSRISYAHKKTHTHTKFQRHNVNGMTKSKTAGNQRTHTHTQMCMHYLLKRIFRLDFAPHISISALSLCICVYTYTKNEVIISPCKESHTHWRP